MSDCERESPLDRLRALRKEREVVYTARVVDRVYYTGGRWLRKMRGIYVEVRAKGTEQCLAEDVLKFGGREISMGTCGYQTVAKGAKLMDEARSLADRINHGMLDRRLSPLEFSKVRAGRKENERRRKILKFSDHFFSSNNLKCVRRIEPKNGSIIATVSKTAFRRLPWMLVFYNPDHSVEFLFNPYRAATRGFVVNQKKHLCMRSPGDLLFMGKRGHDWFAWSKERAAKALSLL